MLNDLSLPITTYMPGQAPEIVRQMPNTPKYGIEDTVSLNSIHNGPIKSMGSKQMTG